MLIHFLKKQCNLKNKSSNPYFQFKIVAVSMAYSLFFIFFSLRTRKSSCFSPCGDYSLFYAPYIFNLINILSFYRSMVWNYALNHILKNQQSQAFRFLKNFSPLIPKIFLKRLAYFYFAMILSCCPHRKFERIKEYRTLTIK